MKHQVYPFLGNTPINQITHSDVQDMVNSLSEDGLSYSSVKKAYEAVNGCIKAYRIKSESSFNPCEGVRLPTNTQRDISSISFFDEEQRNKIKAEAVILTTGTYLKSKILIGDTSKQEGPHGEETELNLSEDLRKLVVYQDITDEDKIWVRDYNEFISLRDIKPTM